MYEILKRILKTLTPNTIIKKYATQLRRVNKLLYFGNKHRCNICESRLRRFIIHKNNLLCPVCGSLSRTRNLHKYLLSNNLMKDKVLHFSPPESLFNTYNGINSIDYFPTDYLNEFQSKYQFNITDIPKDDNFFEVIICYHVLEHIEEDRNAMKELYRVLSDNGTLLIQTPFKKGDIYEDSSITSKEERLRAFGQSDHVRIYSLNGLINRFKEVNPASSIKHHITQEDPHYGLTKDNIIVIEKT
ncbi:class I SAM-dependent methyltransferase [Nonlabens sp.]|uniref:class I SAM-dependent methyltransferase n=1 Tax=Nonlabens sp. TaxID=1888209 RepID=UPI003F699CF5